MIVIQNSLVKKVIALSQIIALQLKIVQRTNIVTSKFRYLLIFTAKVEWFVKFLKVELKGVFSKSSGNCIVAPFLCFLR